MSNEISFSNPAINLCVCVCDLEQVSPILKLLQLYLIYIYPKMHYESKCPIIKAF